MNQNDYWVGVRSCEHEEELNKSGVRVHLNDELWEARGRFHMKWGWGRGWGWGTCISFDILVGSYLENKKCFV